MARTIKSAGVAAGLLAMLQLGACNSGTSPASQDASAPSQVSSAPDSGVTRETPVPDEPAVAAMPAQAAIQSQPGPDGSQVDLLKVAVTGDILTVTWRCSGPEKINSENFSLKDISVIDDSTSQRIAVLKDGNGDWLASNIGGNSIMTECEVKPGVFWAKFAAPSPQATTVSVNLPKVAPFDGVPVARAGA